MLCGFNRGNKLVAEFRHSSASGAGQSRAPLSFKTISFPAEKFSHPEVTATGAKRASVSLRQLETLWFNMGTLCNLSCANCYIESSPKNDRLTYIGRDEARKFMVEARKDFPTTREIGFTGGEPFMNPDLIAMIGDALGLDFHVLVLTNAMRPMQHVADRLERLHSAHPGKLAIRVSLDHHEQDRHESIRGPRSWLPAIQGLRWLSEKRFDLTVAARMIWGESEAAMRNGFRRLFERLEIEIDADDPARLVLFPEMDESRDPPEITDDCWRILGKSPNSVMCATSRMVVRRKDDAAAVLVACTLLPYDKRFELGSSLKDAAKPISLNHRHCATFCVLGGASCSPHRP